MRKNKLRGLMTVMLVSILTLWACAPGGNETGDDRGSDFVQGVTDDAIYFANSAAVSGALAPVGMPFQAGMQAYIEMVNAGGGVHGRELRYLHIDDGFDPAQGVAALEGFLHDDQVFAIVGHFGTPVIGATFPTLVESGIPTVYFAAGIGVVYNEHATDGNGRNTFPVQPVFPMEGRIFSAWSAGQFEATAIGLIHTNDDAGADFYQGVTRELATINEARAAAGLEEINLTTAQIDPNVEDVTAQVATVLAEDVDVIIVGSIQSTLPQILRGLAAQGNTAPVITSYVNADVTMTGLVAADIGGAFEVYASAWVDMTSEEMALYREWVAQVSNEDLSNNSFAMTGWIAMHFFVEGLERAGVDVTWVNFIEAMEQAPIQNPFGPAIDFSNGNRVGTQDLALVRMNANEEAGWEGFLPFMSIEEILGN
ncbi:MAG: ABC transporter substrate-binding protein [Defluviitaleaceae bacterium]|nr:ABC transporter substrate-binding protein [Defluviitaleaceae bacterium]